MIIRAVLLIIAFFILHPLRLLVRELLPTIIRPMDTFIAVCTERPILLGDIVAVVVSPVGSCICLIHRCLGRFVRLLSLREMSKDIL